MMLMTMKKPSPMTMSCLTLCCWMVQPVLSTTESTCEKCEYGETPGYYVEIRKAYGSKLRPKKQNESWDDFFRQAGRCFQHWVPCEVCKAEEYNRYWQHHTEDLKFLKLNQMPPTIIVCKGKFSRTMTCDKVMSLNYIYNPGQGIWVLTYKCEMPECPDFGRVRKHTVEATPESKLWMEKRKEEAKAKEKEVKAIKKAGKAVDELVYQTQEQCSKCHGTGLIGDKQCHFRKLLSQHKYSLECKNGRIGPQSASWHFDIDETLCCGICHETSLEAHSQWTMFNCGHVVCTSGECGKHDFRRCPFCRVRAQIPWIWTCPAEYGNEPNPVLVSKSVDNDEKSAECYLSVFIHEDGSQGIFGETVWMKCDATIRICHERFRTPAHLQELFTRVAIDFMVSTYGNLLSPEGKHYQMSESKPSEGMELKYLQYQRLAAELS